MDRSKYLSHGMILVGGRNPANQLRLAVYAINNMDFYIPGDAGFPNHQQYGYEMPAGLFLFLTWLIQHPSYTPVIP